MFEKTIAGIGASLRKNKIPYMIIGGQAVLLYGEPRLTRDIDITLGVNVDRLGEVLSVVHELAFRPLPDDVREFVQRTMVLPVLDQETGIRVDFIFSFTPYESDAIKRAHTVTIMGEEVCFASPEDLVIHKIFAGRPRDLEDARIVILKNPGVDMRYIRDRLAEFDEASEEKGFLKIFEEIVKGA